VASFKPAKSGISRRKALVSDTGLSGNFMVYRQLPF
jgi:hypothetical protein